MTIHSFVAGVNTALIIILPEAHTYTHAKQEVPSVWSLHVGKAEVEEGELYILFRLS